MKKQIKIAFCIPLFNEEKKIHIIKRNIELIAQILPEFHIFFNDNHSTDKTYDKLLLIQKKWPERIFIYRQQSNIGFSKNLSHFGAASNYIKERSRAEYFQLLGADDVITKKGLLHLKKQIETSEAANLIISNWIYTIKRGKRIKVLGDFDISVRKTCLTLETFFSRKFYIPGGIMQYCIHRSKLKELKNYEKEISPHVGVFFDCFPGRVICAGPPGLCRVRKNQGSGWRSTSLGVVDTHVMCFKMYIRFLKKAFKDKKVFKTTYKRLLKEYTRLSWLIFKECHEGKWGKWAPSRKDKIVTYFFMLKGLLRGSLYSAIANLRYLQKTIQSDRERNAESIIRRVKKSALRTIKVKINSVHQKKAL